MILCRDLGVYVDSKLSYDEHISKTEFHAHLVFVKLIELNTHSIKEHSNL